MDQDQNQVGVPGSWFMVVVQGSRFKVQVILLVP